MAASGTLVVNGCTDHAECNDGNVCTVDQCLSGTCSHSANIYGDLDHNDKVDLFDLFAVLNAFSGDDPCCGG